MKKFLLIVVALLLVSPALLQADLQNNKPVDSWFGKDKFAHLTASAFLYCWQYELLDKPFQLDENDLTVWSLSLTLLWGVGKELYDMTKEDNFFSYKDLAFDILGCIAGMVIISNM
jgi:uncharacterized protein YfiM (DUF2279 family)